MMMKKITKKLELSKETLRNLDRADLEKVAGGATAAHCITYTCQCTNAQGAC